MDFSTIIGLVIGFGMILAAFVMEGGNVAGLLQITAAMIVFGGTIGAVMISFPLDNIKRALKIAKIIFVQKDYNEIDIINQLADLSEKARKDGLLSLEQDTQSNPNPLIRKGLSLVVDGIETEVIKDILVRETYLHEHEFHSSATIFEAAGGYSPTMGIVGTVMGLISVLSNLSNPNELGAKIALAFIATLFGVGFANLAWLPFATKIKVKGKKEKMINDLIIEGLLSIQAGENPRIIKEKLNLSLLEQMSGKKPSEVKEDEGVRAEG
ncbi:MAG: flagellar motor protein [Deltaproteobacteria bacterium]